MNRRLNTNGTEPDVATVTQDVSEIQVLVGNEAIRIRPEMYVGDLNDPSLFNRLIQDAMCIAVDEVSCGYSTEISVSVAPDFTITIRHNGRGLSMEQDADGEVLAERLLTRLYACRDEKDADRKQLCCQMGVVVVNALSEWLRVRNFWEGDCWMQEYHFGRAIAPFARESPTGETGLEFAFRPDLSILRDLRFDAEHLARWGTGLELGLNTPEIVDKRRVGEPIVLRFRKVI